jgi:hypothetical protein
VLIHGAPRTARGAAAGKSASVTKVSRRLSPKELKNKK